MSKLRNCKKVLKGLTKPGEILRDQWGIPHLRAETTHDVFVLNGYAHASDRMWQMEAAFRRAVGRFAEWAGPAALPADRLARQLGCEAASRRDYEALSPATKQMLIAYAEGVNAWVNSGGTAPEYGLLDARPIRWEPWFGVAVMRQRGILMGSIWFKLWRAAALGTVGSEAVPLLRYEDGGSERYIVPQGEEGRRLTASLEELKPAIQALAEWAPVDGTVAGSNNWAVSGDRTASGQPLVAGDPHRQYEIPGMYTQLHLTGPDFDAIGFSVPGVPAFPHFCHTERVAWCVTHTFADIHDIYVEEFSDTGQKYKTPDGWADVVSRQETIATRNGSEETIIVRQTRHGPVVAGDPTAGKALALKSVQLFDTDRSLDCLLPMLTARTLNGFYETCKGWGVIDHNLVGADRDGHIGVLVRAMVPDRDRVNGWLPVPGWTDEHEWRGIIPFEQMPKQLDPEQGYVVTANNRAVPEDFPYYFTTDCHPTTRASRVAARIERVQGLTAGDMIDILRDTDSARAREITAHILQADVPQGAKIIDALSGWDGRMDPGLTAPTVYYRVRQEMTRLLCKLSGLDAASAHPAASPAPGIAALSQLWWTLPSLLRDNDTSLLNGKTWPEVIASAVASVASDLPFAPWGEAHRPVFSHPLAHVFPGAPGVQAPLSDPVGGDGDCVMVTGGYPDFGTGSIYGAVARYVFDLADWDNCRWIVLHGSSGHSDSPHYSDQNPLWARGEMVPMLFTGPAVNANAVARESFEPAS